MSLGRRARGSHSQAQFLRNRITRIQGHGLVDTGEAGRIKVTSDVVGHSRYVLVGMTLNYPAQRIRPPGGMTRKTSLDESPHRTPPLATLLLLS